MPLHDWNKLEDWETLHFLWIAELARWVKPRLPSGYRVSLAKFPAVGGLVSPSPDTTFEPAPDQEEFLASINPARAVRVTRMGTLVAVIELISPVNKLRPETCRSTTDRFIGYLTQGIHLLMIDIHPQPLGFSFPDDLAAVLKLVMPSLSSPCAASYRVGEPAPIPGAGHYLALWRRPLAIGGPLPVVPLPLTRDIAVLVDLEQTYMRAATDSYL